MATYHLKGRITEAGLLEVELPAGIAPGGADVTVTVTTPAAELHPWTDDELADLLKTEPKTGAEIVAEIQAEGGWEDDGTTGAEWVERMRREEEQRRNLPKW